MIKMFHSQNRNSGFKGGYLYNEYCASNPYFAPSNFSIPSKSDYDQLSTYLGGDSISGGKMKTVNHWESPNVGATNSSDFSALPSGTRAASDGGFYSRGAAWQGWMSDRLTVTSYGVSLVFTEADYRTAAYPWATGFSIRLIYTGSGSPTSVTDYDGNIYDVIQIGTQYWVKQNWKCTHLNNGGSLTKVTSSSTWTAASSGDYYYCAYDNNDDLV